MLVRDYEKESELFQMQLDFKVLFCFLIKKINP